MNTPISIPLATQDCPNAPKKRKLERTTTWFDFDNESSFTRVNRVLFNDPTGPSSYTRRTAIVNLLLDTCDTISINNVKSILDEVELICLKAKFNHDAKKIDELEKKCNNTQ